MPRRLQLLSVALVVLACSQPSVQSTPAPTSAAPPPAARPPATTPLSSATAAATLRDAAGTSVGNATFRDTRAGVLITGTLSGLGLGAHGIHIHAVGQCQAPFTTAGGHFNPENKHHGYLSADGPHLGDLPNVDTPASGPLSFEFLLANVSLKGKNALLDADGASIVVHSGRDDFTTDPAGNSGSRMACGVILAR